MTEALRFPLGLYGITPDWDDPDRLEQAIRAAARGGMRSLQLRHKTASSAVRGTLARRCRDVCRELGIVFLVNDDWRLACEVGADGVHIGRHDDEPGLVRRAIGTSMLLGVTCYADLARAQALLQHDVSYIAFGAMFVSATKPLAPPAPLAVLTAGQALVKTFEAPRPAVVAIGGIGPQHALQLSQAGADAIAVVGSLFYAPDIEVAARALSAPFVTDTSQPLSS